MARLTLDSNRPTESVGSATAQVLQQVKQGLSAAEFDAAWKAGDAAARASRAGTCLSTVRLRYGTCPNAAAVICTALTRKNL